MRCLEAGAGGGSFARWLHTRTGDVVAADLDVRLLEPLDELDVWQLDLVADELPREAFDFVHTRLVLIHIAERDAVLRKLVGSLRPGGLLMLEEDDIHPILATATGAYRESWLAFWAYMTRAGVDAEWARGLPERLAGLGLTGVGAEIDGRIFPGGSTTARFWSMTWLQVLPDDTAAGRAALEDSAHWFIGPAKVVAWGRRPA